MFEVLSHQTHMHQHKLGEGKFLNSFFCVYLDCLYTQDFPHWQRHTHILRQRRRMHLHQCWEEYGEYDQQMEQCYSPEGRCGGLNRHV